MSRIIAIANQKGGVGKTTTAINLCASLAALEKKTLLVDLDPQSNATSGLGLDRKAIGKSVYDVLLADADLRLAIRGTEAPHLFLAPSSIDLVGAEVELAGAENREIRLREALQGLREEYDFLIVDCPPSLGLLTLNGLVAAEEVLIPIQCEYYALEGLGQLLKTVELVKSKLNPVVPGQAGRRGHPSALPGGGLRDRDPPQRAPGRSPFVRQARSVVRHRLHRGAVLSQIGRGIP
jgi:chromosome partitioning protein